MCGEFFRALSIQMNDYLIKLKHRIKKEEGFTMLELLVVILIIGNLVAIALPSFLGQKDKSYDKEAEIAVNAAAKSILALNQEAILPSQAQLESSLEAAQPAYNFKDYGSNEFPNPSTGPTDLSLERERNSQASICARSRSGTYFCARVNGALGLTVTDSDPSIIDHFGNLVASVNPINPASASAAAPVRYQNDLKMSVCKGEEEVSTRGCLSDSILDALEVNPEDPGPGEEPLDPVNELPPDSGSGGEPPPAPAPAGSDQFILTPGENVIGVNRLRLSGNSQIYGGAGSNGPVTISDSARVCGSLRYGEGTPSPVGNVSWDPSNIYTNGTGGGVCPGNTIQAKNLYYPNVVLSQELQTHNSNWRLASADPVPGNVWQRGNINWNPATRVLQLNYSELTLLGDEPYLLCRLVVTGGSRLKTHKTGAPTRIFFDSPEHCNGETVPFVLNGGGTLENNGFVPGFFMLGSPTATNTINFSGGGTVLNMVLYAPQTDISASGGFRFDGALVAKDLNVVGGTNINTNFNGSTYGIPTAPGPTTP